MGKGEEHASPPLTPHLFDPSTQDVRRPFFSNFTNYMHRYSRLLNKCHEVITIASSCDEYTEDMIQKLDAMSIVYRIDKHTHGTFSNIEVTAVDTSTHGTQSKKALSPRAVRGKGRPSSLRRAFRMEKELTKIKTRGKKTIGKGKRKQLTLPRGAESSYLEVSGTQLKQRNVGTLESACQFLGIE